MMTSYDVEAIRGYFQFLYAGGALSDNGTYEIINASFWANENSIFGKPNLDYLECEMAWYESQSRSVYDMPCKVPTIWDKVSSRTGLINSNYGWCIFSEENKNQFDEAMTALISDRNSRQAVMIYNRPSMHQDAVKDGMSDFMCTNTVQVLIRENQVYYRVDMRSNDAVFGYKNDFHWHNLVFDKVMEHLKFEYPLLTKGPLMWNVGSLHVYPRHFHLLQNNDDLLSDEELEASEKLKKYKRGEHE